MATVHMYLKMAISQAQELALDLKVIEGDPESYWNGRDDFIRQIEQYQDRYDCLSAQALLIDTEAEQLNESYLELAGRNQATMDRLDYLYAPKQEPDDDDEDTWFQDNDLDDDDDD